MGQMTFGTVPSWFGPEGFRLIQIRGQSVISCQLCRRNEAAFLEGSKTGRLVFELF